eukprot:TRINITY_DN24104_c0_g1_i1.p1 TRINITY_DN24104_c0_g1~~TRINITY_DN24104_c0_g1_i1.p1  ORF type:complete len:323 (-),score=50.26 TRINITY_DN24104_c0_g1_i1:68-1036(-)
MGKGDDVVFRNSVPRTRPARGGNEDTSHTSNTSDKRGEFARQVRQDLQYLHEVFPTLDAEVVVNVYEQSQHDLNRAIDTFTSMDEEQKKASFTQYQQVDANNGNTGHSEGHGYDTAPVAGDPEAVLQSLIAVFPSLDRDLVESTYEDCNLDLAMTKDVLTMISEDASVIVASHTAATADDPATPPVTPPLARPPPAASPGAKLLDLLASPARVPAPYCPPMGGLVTPEKESPDVRTLAPTPAPTPTTTTAAGDSAPVTGDGRMVVLEGPVPGPVKAATGGLAPTTPYQAINAFFEHAQPEVIDRLLSSNSSDLIERVALMIT